MSEETENQPTQATGAPFRSAAASTPPCPGAAMTPSAARRFQRVRQGQRGRSGRTGCPRGRCFAGRPAPARRTTAIRRGDREPARTDRPRTRPCREAVCQNGDSRHANRNSAKASSRFPAKALVFCATRNAISSRRRRTFSSRRKSCAAFSSRDGMWIYGETRRGNRGPQLTRLLKINDDEPTKYQDLRPFEELTTINPNRADQA